MDVTVRTAGPADLEQILDLGVMACDEIGLAPPDRDLMRARFEPLLRRDGGMIGVIGDERLAGFVPLTMAPPWYGTDPVLQELVLYVHPDFRRTPDRESGTKWMPSRALITYAMDAADRMRVPLSIGVFNSVRTKAKVELYRRMLGDPVGAMFLYRPTGEAPSIQTDKLEEPIRVGTTDDVHRVMDLAIAGCHEGGFVRPDPRRLLEGCWPALTGEGGVMGVIGEPGKPLAGAILIHRSKLWYSGTGFLEEKSVFVDPAHRGARGGAAARLCEFGKLAAERMSLPLSIGVLSNERTEAKVRLYRRQFGEPVGAYFLRGSRTGDHDVR
jgi:GNAT superfamily N-acetyltransferase